jgi:hypothetical protein
VFGTWSKQEFKILCFKAFWPQWGSFNKLFTLLKYITNSTAKKSIISLSCLCRFTLNIQNIHIFMLFLLQNGKILQGRIYFVSIIFIFCFNFTLISDIVIFHNLYRFASQEHPSKWLFKLVRRNRTFSWNNYTLYHIQ